MSFVIRERATGKLITECARDTAPGLRSPYESVPMLQHLQELNDPTTLAYAWARRDITTQPKE